LVIIAGSWIARHYRGGGIYATEAIGEIAAEKSPVAVQSAKYVFDAWILPELGSIQIEKLTTDRLNGWRNKLATQPKRVRSKLTASKPATRETADDDDARRARKATAKRILNDVEGSAQSRLLRGSCCQRQRLAEGQAI
jgi:hypothetical protein